MRRIRRSGFTLNEVVISLVILGIIGTAFTRTITYQTRYLAHETSLRTARSVARSGSNILVSDLRTVQDSGGVDSVTSDGKLIRILVPYRFGLICATVGTTTTVSMLPTDSATIALSVYKGFAWRGATGRYTYLFPSNPTTTDLPVTAVTPALCTGSAAGQAQIRTVSANGRTGQTLDLKTTAATGATSGSPVFMFQKITYSFRTSGVYPSALGLWRNVEGGVNEELVAPFDTSARFRFYQPGDDTSRVAPPTLANIRGLDLVLNALSPVRSSNKAGYPMEKVVTSVFFKNVRAY
jgi:prepilin-type N-terminal cleavage/methylation domain-containing protein